MKTPITAWAWAAAMTCCAAQATPSYLPFGAQSGIALATVLAGGWTACYAEAMAAPIGSTGEQVLNACTGDYILMAARATGSDSFLSLAAALRSDTLIDTGPTSQTHLANGAQWYYSPHWSWGFTALGDSVDNHECDTSVDSPISMCLHTLDLVGGYRINNILNLNVSTDFEKVFFVARRDGTVGEPGTWGVLTVAALAALVGTRGRRHGDFCRADS